MFMFSLVDTQGKLLTEHMHPVQIVWFRQFGLALGCAVLLAWYGTKILRTDAMGLQLARGAAAALSAVLFISAVVFVPLADAVAVSFVAPFIVTVLGALVLGEHVGLRRWAAVLIGFLATLLIIRPGMGAMHPAAFLVIGAAALFAVRQIISRYLARTDATVTTVAYTALASIAVLSVPLPFLWTTPTELWQVGLLISLALTASVAEVLVIKALELAQAVVVAPLHYSIMIWSTFSGWLVFGDLPDAITWVGAAIIMATGLYTLHRERLAARRSAAKP